MIKINTIVSIVMLAIILSSCDGITSEFPETPSKFIVNEIRPNKTSGTNIYLAIPLGDTKDLDVNSTWFVDSVGVFNVGDTISFQLVN